MCFPTVSYRLFCTNYLLNSWLNLFKFPVRCGREKSCSQVGLCGLTFATSEGAEIDLQIPALASSGALDGTVLKANPLQILISVSRKLFDRPQNYPIAKCMVSFL